MAQDMDALEKELVELTNKQSKTSEKLNNIANTLYVIGVVATVFGISGAYVYKSLNTARKEITELQKDKEKYKKELIAIREIEEAKYLEFVESTNSDNPDFDTDWISLKKSTTVKYTTGFSEIPKLITGYYRIDEDLIIPWGVNQYGDSYSVNGVLIDFDDSGNLYIRTPKPVDRYDGFPIHIGYFNHRTNSGTLDLFDKSVDDVEFRVMAWK
ncbi:hypothetical protein N9954_02700 [Maribacter sp.]|nr:hypothetical protein [Maribacter sp.]